MPKKDLRDQQARSAASTPESDERAAALAGHLFWRPGYDQEQDRIREISTQLAARETGTRALERDLND